MFVDLEDGQTVNTNHIVAFAKSQVLTVVGKFDISEKDYDNIRFAVMPRRKSTTAPGPNAEILELFEKLHRLTGGKSKAIFTQAREKKLKELLNKHRMTEDDLIKAATNIGQDDFLQGDNDNNKRYGDIDYLLRPDKAAKWAEDQTKRKKTMF